MHQQRPKKATKIITTELNSLFLLFMSDSAGIFCKFIFIHRCKPPPSLFRLSDNTNCSDLGLGSDNTKDKLSPAFFRYFIFMLRIPACCIQSGREKELGSFQCVGVYCDLVFSLLSILYGMFINKKLSNQDQDVIPLFLDRVTLFAFFLFWYVVCFASI